MDRTSRLRQQIQELEQQLNASSGFNSPRSPASRFTTTRDIQDSVFHPCVFLSLSLSRTVLSLNPQQNTQFPSSQQQQQTTNNELAQLRAENRSLLQKCQMLEDLMNAGAEITGGHSTGGGGGGGGELEHTDLYHQMEIEKQYAEKLGKELTQEVHYSMYYMCV